MCQAANIILWTLSKMKSRRGLVTLDCSTDRVRRWVIYFKNGHSPRCFGTSGRLTYIDHKIDKLRNKARQEIARKFANVLDDPYHHLTLDRYILQGDSNDVIENLNEYEEMFLEHLTP